MWTNVFRIGGLHQISWFQFLPDESEFHNISDKSVKLDQKDAANILVLSAHLQLQMEGLLTAWTNSFVGPWDPSQGLHNPDEKIKLWLFLPGQHSAVVEKAQPAVARLRVLASGLWVAPGDSEEVSAALSRALRNCIERSLRGLSYVRFGDVFSKYLPSSNNEELFRRGQPVAEFIFTATEEAIFVHVIVSAKYVRAISCGDLEPFLGHSSGGLSDGVSVIVSPHGIRGKLTGCCPSDLVEQVYMSSGKFKGPNGIVGPPYNVANGSGLTGQLRGQNRYVEVTLGSLDKMMLQNAPLHANFCQPHIETSDIAKGTQRGPLDKPSFCEKMFVYPAEAVLVPVMQTSFARSSLKRIWLQNWVGQSLLGSSLFLHCFGVNSDGTVESRGGYGTRGARLQRDYPSSSNSNSSSNGSISSSSSDVDRHSLGAGDLEADADSLMSRQSGLSSLGQMQNDGLHSGSKRPRMGTSESFGPAGMVLNPSMSDYGAMEVNNVSITGVPNDQFGSRWGWDDDDRGIGMDIHALVAEFGDFGDFFEDDALPFGEPPGTAESQVLMLPAPDGGEMSSSPNNLVIDVSDQMVLPAGFPTFDSFGHLPPPPAAEDLSNKIQEATTVSASGQVSCPLPSFSGEFDHVVKAEALMSFAPEYGAVETTKSEVSSVVFRNPYVPKSRKVDSASISNNYVYSATPPSSPCCAESDEKSTLPGSFKACRERKNRRSPLLESKRYYTHVERGKRKTDRSYNSFSKCEDGVESSQSSFLHQSNSKSVSDKASASLREDNFLSSANTVLATEIECLVCQASLCRLRHILLSSSNKSPSCLTGLSGSNIPNQSHFETSNMIDIVSRKSELKKKETIPVRIAGDIDGGILDGPLNAPVGVWRSVGIPKAAKTSASSMEMCPPMPHNSFIDETMLSYGHRQPLQELLDGIAILVQQSTSFVDVALDADCGDGPYGWLALQEQWRRGFSCGPSMVHAGCGGVLASCHSLDIAGVELADPLSANVQASVTISLLQSDIKAALKSAFSSVDGPLSVTDWCRGRSSSNEPGMIYDGFSGESIASISECRDSSSAVTLSIGEPMSPSLSSAGAVSSLKADGTRSHEVSERRSNLYTSLSESDQQQCSRSRPTVSVIPFPPILVGYQDDWLKTSVSSLQVWEKAPLEPFAMPKHMAYYVVCPNIDPLTTAAADFFLQLGTVYETCKLGTHVPHCPGNEMETDSAKISPGFVLVDSPQSMKIDTKNASMLGSISDFFLCLSNGWDVSSYLKSLSKVLKSLNFSSSGTTNAKEGTSGQCTVIYVVCPFPDPLAVLQTVVESSVAIGSVVRSSDKEKRSMMHNLVAKALSCPAAADESFSNVLTLTGFSMPKLVLQIVTVDAIFRVTGPPLSELIILKEIAFTVYNKARRITRGVSSQLAPSLSVPGRSHSVMMQPVPGMWKDSRGGPVLQRESELDGSLRPGNWDNSWQTARSGGLGCDANRTGDVSLLDEIRCMFEPLFILAEPGSLQRGLSPFLGTGADSSKLSSDDSASTNFMQSSASSVSGDNGPASQPDSLDSDGFGSGNQKSLPSLHCCYGWTEDWRWMVCIWTDSRGELLDSYVYPFGGVSSRQDTKGLQSLFIQILQQGCQILQACSPDVGSIKPRDLVITRIGCFFELECQEWQKALYSAGGSDIKKWSLQLRRSFPDGMSSTSNGTSLQQPEMGLMQERTLPSSPSPMYTAHSKAFTKSGMGQPSSRKQLMSGHAVLDNSKGLLQWVQSISFVSVSIDHSLQLVFQADSASSGASQGSASSIQSSYLEGYTPVKSLGSASASYIFIPSPSMRFLPPAILQLPTCLTADSPPLAHLLHSKGSAIPLSTGFVVSKAVPSMRKDSRTLSKEEWPSVLSVSLIDYYGGNNFSQEKMAKGGNKSVGRGISSDPKDFEVETHVILESLTAELHALSWMTVSPAYLERRSALPFHCDMVLRLRRLLHFADKELSRLPEKGQV